MKKKKPSRRALKNKCWDLFSEWIRRRDADEGGTTSCFTCGKLAHWKDLQAGHAIGGRGGAVLFDADIVYPQCRSCNGPPKYGNYQVYIPKLIKQHGQEWWEAKEFSSRKVVKYTRSDLEDLILILKTKLAILDNICRGCEDKNCRINGCMGA